jgi:5-(carboxyamino)imidazole ribonucleotide mutase
MFSLNNLHDSLNLGQMNRAVFSFAGSFRRVLFRKLKNVFSFETMPGVLIVSGLMGGRTGLQGVRMESRSPMVGLIMGSISDWKILKFAAVALERFDVVYEKRIVSAHRTPDLLHEYAREAKGRGIEVIIAGAGGAAHLPGMVASMTTIPVLGVPVPSTYLKGIDSLLSIVQMPKGIPVATFAIGESGAENAALFAISILGLSDQGLGDKLVSYRRNLTQSVLDIAFPEDE